MLTVPGHILVLAMLTITLTRSWAARRPSSLTHWKPRNRLNPGYKSTTVVDQRAAGFRGLYRGVNVI